MLSRLFIISTLFISDCVFSNETVFEAGHNSLRHWVLGKIIDPEDNLRTSERVDLGKKLFFDARLSGEKNRSCSTCHNPLLGWSDGLPTSRGINNIDLKRASPSVVNSGYNTIQMWDGRNKTLEEQALGPLESPNEMNADINQLLEFLSTNSEYSRLFSLAYPQLGINKNTLLKALSAFQRTLVSNQSPFDRWVAGDSNALTAQQINGFKLFVDPNKGNCEVCHSAPNFTDNGFHNLGLVDINSESADLGRFNIVPIGILKAAFKTPALRDVEFTAPYFHNGSAKSLSEVMRHYNTFSDLNRFVSPNLKVINLAQGEINDIVSFMQALSSPKQDFIVPILPK